MLAGAASSRCESGLLLLAGASTDGGGLATAVALDRKAAKPHGCCRWPSRLLLLLAAPASANASLRPLQVDVSSECFGRLFQHTGVLH